MSRIFDITRPLTEALSPWPGDLPYREEYTADYAADGCRVSAIHLSTHLGTHIDAPAHYVPNGATVDALPLSRMLGRCYVLDWREKRDFTAIPSGTKRLLLRSPASEDTRDHWLRHSPALSLAEAKLLIAHGVELLGVDGPSVEAFDGDGQVHLQLLRANLVLLEGLCLSGVAEGWYHLICCPLALVGLEGAPARALLIKEDTA